MEATLLQMVNSGIVQVNSIGSLCGPKWRTAVSPARLLVVDLLKLQKLYFMFIQFKHFDNVAEMMRLSSYSPTLACFTNLN